MTGSRRILVKNKILSFLSRCLVALLVLTAVITCAGLNLQYLYRMEVNDYFDRNQASEQSLVIRTGQYTLLAKGSNRDNFSPLLSQELGEYRMHRFVGWNADIDDFMASGEMPYTMLYEVDYEKGSTKEYFHFTGLLSPVLAARDVWLLGE